MALSRPLPTFTRLAVTVSNVLDTCHSGTSHTEPLLPDLANSHSVPDAVRRLQNVKIPSLVTKRQIVSITLVV